MITAQPYDYEDKGSNDCEDGPFRHGIVQARCMLELLYYVTSNALLRLRISPPFRAIINPLIRGIAE
jgi:hypothetical protein